MTAFVYTLADRERLLDHMAKLGRSLHDCQEAFLHPEQHHDLVLRLREEKAA